MSPLSLSGPIRPDNLLVGLFSRLQPYRGTPPAPPGSDSDESRLPLSICQGLVLK